MIEWVVQWHAQMVFNYAVIQGLMPYCDATILWRLLAFSSFTFWVVRWVLAAISQMRLQLQLNQLTPPDPSILRAFQLQAEQLGFKQTPPLYLGNLHQAAFAGGFFKRFVFINQALATQLNRDELNALFCHELVHIKRRDHWKLALVEGILFTAPYWMMQFFLHQIGCKPEDIQTLALLSFILLFLGWRYGLAIYQNFREWSCDDRAVKITQKPLALASALLKTWRWLKQTHPSRSMALVFANKAVGPQMEKRIRRLIDYRRPICKPILAQCFRVSGIFMALYIGWFIYDFHFKSQYQQRFNHCTSLVETHGCAIQQTPETYCNYETVTCDVSGKK